MTGEAAVVVRAAVVSDVAAVVALEQEHLGPDPWSQGLVAAGIEGDVPTVHYLVALVDDTVVGHAVLSAVADTAELQRIAVATARRRRGIAGRLLDASIALAAGTGAGRLLLEVRDDNLGAQAFYAARGLVELHRRAGYYRDGTTAVVLALPLADDRLGADVGTMGE